MPFILFTLDTSHFERSPVNSAALWNFQGQTLGLAINLPESLNLHPSTSSDYNPKNTFSIRIRSEEKKEKEIKQEKIEKGKKGNPLISKRNPLISKANPSISKGDPLFSTENLLISKENLLISEENLLISEGNTLISEGNILMIFFLFSIFLIFWLSK